MIKTGIIAFLIVNLLVCLYIIRAASDQVAGLEAVIEQQAQIIRAYDNRIMGRDQE